MSYKYLLDFLRELKENNNREWFNANRERYDLSLNFFRHEVKRLIEVISEYDSDIAYLKPESCIFRIYRDVRFSPDKSPYKTHFGAYIAKNGGRKSEYAGYYFHIDAVDSVLSGGVYAPQKEVLRHIRAEIDANFDELNKITNSKDFKKYFGKIDPLTEPLKKLPMGFSSDSPAAEILKYKHFVLSSPVDDKMMNRPDFIDYVAKVFRTMKLYNDFFNEIIHEALFGRL